MAREELSALAGLWSSCLTSDSEGLVERGLWVWCGPCLVFGSEDIMCVGGLWVWLFSCFTSSGEVMGCDGGLWIWCDSCFTSDEGMELSG